MFALITSAAAQNPTLYLRGDISGSGWPAVEKYKFTENNGVYTLNLDELSGQFKIADSGWTTPNGNWGGGAQVEVGGTYTLVSNGGNMSVKGGLIKNCTLTFTLSSKQLKVTGQAVANSYSLVYLVGDFGDGWNDARTDYPMTLKAGSTLAAGQTNTWEATYSLSGTTYFKMRAGTYVYGTGKDSDINVEMEESYTASQSGNAFVLGKGDYTFTYVLPYNGESGTLTVTGEGLKPDVNYGNWYVNVYGPFNNWQDNGVQPVDKISTTTDLAIGTQGFKIKVWNGAEDIHYIAADGTVPVGEWTQLVVDGYDASPTQISGATETSVYTVKYNVETNEVYVELTSGGEIEPVYPETLYLIGDINGWDPENGDYKFDNEGDGFFTIQSVTLPAAKDSELSYVSIISALQPWDNVSNYRYGATETNNDDGDSYVMSDIKKNDSKEVNFVKGSNSWGVPAGEYDITVSFEDNTITFDCLLVTGITNISADENAPVEYFNLQGVRVANPENGIFIVRQGSKVTKVIR